MSEAHSPDEAEPYELIPGRYGVVLTRTGEAALEGRLPMESHLCRPDGSMRTAAVLMGIDMTAGMAGGLGVYPEWSVTSDADVRLVGPCTVGPLRVDATNIRAGRTQSLVDVRAVDEGDHDRLVALATANHGVLTPSFDPALGRVPIGDRFPFTRPADAIGTSLEDAFGVTLADGVVSAPVDVRTTNPWGIFHGGLTGLLVEKAIDEAGIVEPRDVGLRFLRPAKVGPVDACVVDTVDRVDDRLARIELWDRGADRLAVLAHVAGG